MSTATPQPFIEDTHKPLSPSEASQYLGGTVSAEKLVEAAQRNQIGHYKLPFDGAYLFMRADLMEYVLRNEFRREPSGTSARKNRRRQR